MMTESDVRERIEQYNPSRFQGRLNIVSDTTEFMSIGYDDVLELGGNYYLVRGDEVEGRFGMDGQPKFWVKKAIDLSDGSLKVIKLVFHESFLMQLGAQQIRCFRSPRKEARVLDTIKGDLSFMQGINVRDRAGNLIRIIDRIQGVRFYDYMLDLEIDHETYFCELFPGIFQNIIGCIEAITRLHGSYEVHGDIRNDHIMIERGTGRYRWIDFDYTYEWSENPFGVDLYGLGNVLLLAVGMDFHAVRDFASGTVACAGLTSPLQQEDLSLFFIHRIINLQKLFPYIPDSLNHVLMHFSQGANVFYMNAQELLTDLRACEGDLKARV